MKRGCRRIHILLALIYVSHVQSLDIDSAVCRCAKKSKFGKPFVVLWNAPTEGCHINFSVNIELEKYGILTNSNQTWDGEVVTVFYNGQLGLYPFYRHDDEKMKYNAGLPQLVNLTAHLKKVSLHIELKIPEPNYSGLAVIDWEGWRPIWDTNFGKKYIYQVESVRLVRKEGKIKNKTEIRVEAKKRFESAGKRLMVETIELAKKLRPRALWGFYGFPGCHGNCTQQNKNWNDQLGWLYESSTALFPSIYLMDDLSDNNKYVADRLREAFRSSRVQKGPGFGDYLPVFPYLRPLYHFGARDFKMLNEMDLENAIGQTVDFGSAGLILWGNHYDERTSREICLKYNEYVNKKLGPYINLLTEELEACSRHKCFSNGRCVEEAVVGKDEQDERSCQTTVQHGTVFKMERSKASEIPQKTSTSTLVSPSKTTNNRIIITDEYRNSKSNKFIPLDSEKTVKNFISKANKSKTEKPIGLRSTSTHKNLAKEALLKIENLSNKLREMFDSSPNKTRKAKVNPYWNKNAILGYKNKHVVDHLSIKRGHKKNGDNVLGNNYTQKMFHVDVKNRKVTQAFQEESTTKISDTDVNSLATSPRAHTSKDKVMSKHGYSARSLEEGAVRVPEVYIILITVTLGGALLMTIIYVAIYYTVNVRGRSHDNTYKYEYESGDENPFSLDPNSPWWNDDEADATEKLLKSKRDKK